MVLASVAGRCEGFRLEITRVYATLRLAMPPVIRYVAPRGRG
jgi:hypothetical protein